MLDEEKDASAESEDALSDMELAMLIATASALVSSPIAHKAIRKSGRALLAKLQQIAGANRAAVNEAIEHDFRGSFIRNWLADVEDAGKVTPKAASLAAKRAQQRARKPIASVQRYAAKMSQQMAQSAYMEYLKIASEAAFASTGNIDDPGVGYERALSAGIAKMARKGLTASTYTRKDGTVVHVPVDVGIRRAIAAEGREPKIKATLDAADSSFGLVEVSKTANPRDTHHRWEGRVYSTGASIAGFPSFEEVVGDQINDYNCGHRIRVFNPNIGRRFSDPLEGTGYTAEQSAALHTEQAKLENDIRKLKREHEVLHSMKLDTDDVNRRLKYKRGELQYLLSRHPKILSRREWREYTYETARRRLGLYGKVHLDKNQQMTVMLKSGTAYAQSKIRKAERAKLVDRALADNSIAMMERRSMNDRQFRLNARKLKKEKGFFDIAAHGLPGYVEAYGKRIDAETVWDIVRKSDGYSGEDIRLCVCFGAVEDENGRSIAQELANISGKKVKAATKFFFIRQDGSYYVGSDFWHSDGKMELFEPKGKS